MSDARYGGCGVQQKMFIVQQARVFCMSLTETALCADFGLAQLAQSGSRLKSVLLYHMMPGGAFSLDQLASAGNVTTLLGQDLNASYPLQFGKNSTGDVSPFR